MEPLFHVLVAAEWPPTEDPYRPDSLSTVGFVHCSTAAQLAGTIARWFPARSELVVLELDPAQLGAEVVWEDTAGHGEPFPHLYGPIPHRAVRRARPWAPA